ncbi:uncharacterized protein LOC134260224 [Saccostrea cucullata]|uniref:uncharacterized protein LOC134260224 n=1 Tax=Saccostrea cuccullata TaxID=36930 RepID=UPI002ED0AFCC
MKVGNIKKKQQRSNKMGGKHFLTVLFLFSGASCQVLDGSLNRQETVYMLENCGNQSLEIKHAVIIKARRNVNENPPSLNCSLPVHTATNHTIQVNIEKLDLGDGVNCSWKRPHLDFCVNASCNGRKPNST